jgi:two-component system NtrC family sensor kinase
VPRDDQLEELTCFVRLTASDLALLRTAACDLEPHLTEMAELFYGAIRQNARAARVLREGPRQVHQLKGTLVRWARSLLTQERDGLYAEARRRVGHKHVELGLNHRLVLAALGILRTFLIDKIRTAPSVRARSKAAVDALNRALDVDAALITEAYFASSQARLTETHFQESEIVLRIQRLLLESPALAGLDAIRAQLCRVMPIERLVVAVARPEAAVFEIAGLSSSLDVPEVTRGSRIPYSECGMTEVIASGNARLVSLSADDPLKMHRALHAAGIRSVLVEPLWVEDRVIGALNMATVRRSLPAQRRHVFLRSVADAIALALARSEASLALFNSEEQFRALFDAAADGVYVVDAAGRVTACNAVFPGLLGRTTLEVVGRHLDELIPPFAARRAARLGADVLANGVPRVGELVLESDGEPRWFALSYAPIRDAGGETRGLVGFVRDVSEERRRTALHVHEHKMATLGLLAAGIAHEVSNPLASIACMAQDLSEVSTDPEARATLARIVDATRRASGSLQQVLQFVRPGDGRCEPVSVDEVVERTVEIVRFDPRARAHHMRVVRGKRLPLALADGDAISQVLLNLLLNALDAMEDRQGTLTVRTWSSGGRVHVAVADTGPGVPGDLLPRLFEPFVTTKPQGRGTGLGLFVSSQILRAHGGTLTVSSPPGRGATFELSVPAAPVT